jgi:hypothetical protein
LEQHHGGRIADDESGLRVAAATAQDEVGFACWSQEEPSQLLGWKRATAGRRRQPVH